MKIEQQKFCAYPILHINLCLDRFSESAEALGRIWNRLDSSMLHRASDAEKKASPEAPPLFRPTRPRARLCLELVFTTTADEVQRGVVDKELVAFCRMFPTLREILLSPPVPPTRSRHPLREEVLDKLKSVCPELLYGWVY